MASFQLSSIDKTVGTVTQLQITLQLSTNTFETGDVLNFGIQSPGSFQSSSGDLSKCTVSAPTTISVTTCTINTNSVSLTISASATNLKNLRINIHGFINPYSTTQISGNTASLTSSANVLKETASSGKISNFLPDQMTSASLTSSSTVVGKTGATLTVTFVPKNIIKTTGSLVLVFPLRCCTNFHMLEVDNPICTGVTTLKTSLTCSYVKTSRMLTITNILASDQAGGTSMSFTVDNLINPDSTYPKSGFSLTSYDNTGGQIDTISLTLTVSDWGTLLFPTITHDVQTVNTNSVVTLKFSNPYSVQVGCKLRIDFPTDMPVTGALTTVTGSNYFGNGGTLTFTKNTVTNYVEIDGCDSESDPNNDISIFLTYITNQGWVKATSNFQLSLYQMVGTVYYKIAQTTDTISFAQSDFTTGLIDSLIVTAEDTSEIQSSTRYRIKVKPQHNMPTSSLLEITFPSSITLTSGGCTISSAIGGMSTTPTSCNVSGNKLSIQDPFGSTGSYTAGGTLEFVLSSQGTNPQVVQDAGSFVVSTYATISGVNYAIDTDTETNVYTPTPFVLDAVVSLVSSYETYFKPAVYTLDVTNHKTIPQNGKITVQFPTEISLASTGLTSCKIVKNSVTSTLTGCTITSTSPLTITISDAFTSAAYTTVNTPFQLKFDGLVNPRTTATTGSFVISTTNSAGSAIESVSTGVTTQMTSVNSFSAFSITPQSLVTGASTGYKISVTANSPLSNNDVVKVTFPAEVTLPSTVSCTAGTLVITVTCTKTGSNTLEATFTSLSGGAVANGATMDFTVNSVTNPPSTKPSSDFTSIGAYDSLGNQLSSYSNQQVQMTTPATVSTKSITQDSYAIGTANDYTITYTAVNNMAAGAAFQFTYPTSISVPSTLSQCYVTYNSVIYPMDCTINTSTKTIRVSKSSNGVTVPIVAGQSVAITLGSITNPSTVAASYGTFQMTSYSDYTFSYTVDNIPSGISPSLECNYPCKTCSATDRNSCLSCFTTVSTIPEKYLSGTSCLTSCPAKHYFDTSLICYACDAVCATCANNNQCLTCDPTGTYPYFYNNYCYTACPSNTFLSNGVCQACSSNCLTCSGTASTCTSCEPISTTPFLDTATSTCINTCASGQVQVGTQCQTCTSPCATCASTTTTCLTCITGYLYGTTCVSTCPSGSYFNSATSSCITCPTQCSTCSSSTTCTSCPTGTYLYSGTCVSACPTGTYLSGSQCLACSSNCLTCSGSSTNCQSCSGSTSILSQTNRCVSACDAGYVALNGVCQLCTSPCSTCTATQSTCTGCKSGYYLYGSSCITTCPSNTYINTATNQCVTCDSRCQTCTGANTCTSCTSSYPLTQNGMCVSTCSDGYFQSGTQCLPCSSNCKTCSSSASYCTSCNSGGTNPLLSSSNTCVTTCDSGYIAISGKCIQCTSPCQTCIIDQKTCYSCMSSYYLYGTTCIQSCPSGYTQQEQKCVGCDPNCLSCSSTDTTACLKCSNSFILYENTCYEGCPEGYEPDSTNTECIIPGSEDANNGSIYIYFPVLTTQTILTGVAVGSKLKSPASFFFSTTISLWGGLEFIAYIGQVGLAYNREILNDNMEMPSISDSTGLTGRRLQDTSSLASNDYYDVSNKPVVLIGTLFALAFLIITNVLWIILFFLIVNRDDGFRLYRQQFKCTSCTIFVISAIVSHKIARLFYCGFFGLERFTARFDNPRKIHYIFNCLTIMNIVFTLLPIIFVDIYALAVYNWGSQFYIIIIETLLLTIALLVFSVLEFKTYQIQNFQYQPGDQSSINEDELTRRIEEKLKLKYNGEFQQIHNMSDMQGLGPRMMGGPEMVASGFNGELDDESGIMNEKQKANQKLKKIDDEVENEESVAQHRRNSQTDTRLKEEDERRLATDPTDKKSKQRQDSNKNLPNQKSSTQSLNQSKKSSTKSLNKKKNSRNKDANGLESENSNQKNLKRAEERKKERGIEPNFVPNDEDERLDSAQRKLREGKARGRNSKNKVNTPDGKIKEESEQTERGTERPLLEGPGNTDRQKNVETEDEGVNSSERKESKFKSGRKGSDGMNDSDKKSGSDDSMEKGNDSVRTGLKEDEDNSNQKDKDKLRKMNQNKDEESQQLEQQIMDEQSVFEEEKVVGNESKQGQENNKDGKQTSNQHEKDKNKSNKNQDNQENTGDSRNERDPLNLNQQHDQNQNKLGQTIEARALEEEILKSKQEEEEKLNQGKKDLKNNQQTSASKQQPKPKTTQELENEIIQNLKKEDAQADGDSQSQNNSKPQSANSEERGEPDSDDDEETRIRNMRDPDKRKFNVHDITGDLDRDEDGNLILDKRNSKGELTDKKGRKINEKGYLIDGKTGDVVENSRNKKVFDKKDLDERGEIPPPFNLEKFNFNPHDIRGYFDRDAQGNELIGKRKDSKGRPVDKLGRLVNKEGFLIDQDGNLIDKRGKIRLHKKLLDQGMGNIPQLFNYKGKKYDFRDCIGDLDKDRSGNPIIRRDKDNNLVDKRGRRVNKKGYLIDDDENVINKDGKVIFDNYAVSKDGEIPKLFPFVKFNKDEVSGDYEMDPLGNPILQRNSKGDLIDNKGNKVNEKGYLIDEKGNVINKRGYKVFSKVLLEDDGDIPKVFRSGLLRKDTNDSFNQLMNEIEHLENLQSQGLQPQQQKAQKQRPGTSDPPHSPLFEDERMNQRIDKILEEDNDDEDQLMRELEELANDGQQYREEVVSDGGNTSYDSMMGETPSNYNEMNARAQNAEKIRQKARQMRGLPVDEGDELEEGFEGRDLKKRRRKKKKKGKKEDDNINLRDLEMAGAYGGVPQSQIQKYKEALKEQQRENQRNRSHTKSGGFNTPMTNFHTPMQPQNATLSTQLGMYPNGPQGKHSKRNDQMIPEEESRADINSQGGVRKNNRGLQNQDWTSRLPPKVLKPNLRQTKSGNRTESGYNSNRKKISKPTSDNNDHHISPFQHQKIKKNNLMDISQNSLQFDPQRQQQEINQFRLDGNNGGSQDPFDRKLSNIANSVSGFYRDNVSDHSKHRSTHESNVAKSIRQQRSGNRSKINLQDQTVDPEIDRIYGTAKGLNDLDLLSDWEKDSHMSKRSMMSQLTGLRGNKVRQIESIYLQRLEPAAIAAKKVKKKPAQFRVMHHKYHDEADWHIDEDKSEYSFKTQKDVDKYLNSKLVEEFHSKKEVERRKQRLPEENTGQNLFYGNFKNYLEKKIKEQKSPIDLGK